MTAILGAKTCAAASTFGQGRAARFGVPPPSAGDHRPLVGVHPQKGPIIHREAGYALTHKDLDACGEYVPRLASELN
jgi:hypothetical protein